MDTKPGTSRSSSPIERESLRYLDKLYVHHGRELINHPNIAVRELMRTQHLDFELSNRLYKIWLMNMGSENYHIIKTS